MSSFFSVFRVFACLALIPLLLCTASCQDSGTQQQKKPFGVTVMVIEPQSVPVQAELSARVNALRKAEVRPQVNGILQKQLFTEGSLVHEGQSLYKIDPAVYQARVDSAKASLNAAQVHANAAKLRRNRVRNLYAAQAVSQQEWEDADAEWQQAVASVGVCQAALRQAEIDLRYTDVHAPITGRIGKSRFTQGALVTANQTEPLGVLPLSVSHGAGAASQHAIGTGIIGGTFLATALGIFFIPVFFVVVNRVFLSRRRKKDLAARAEKPETSAKDAS